MRTLVILVLLGVINVVIIFVSHAQGDSYATQEYIRVTNVAQTFCLANFNNIHVVSIPNILFATLFVKVD